MTEAELEVREVVDAIQRSVSLEKTELPEAFFPAHLSVALFTALCGRRSRARGESSAARYCGRFGLERVRGDRWELPPPGEQETLRQVAQRFDEFGFDAMATEVFRVTGSVPRAELSNLLEATRALLETGVAILQDLNSRPPEMIEDAVRAVHGIGAHTVRRLLMYGGGEDFVRGDALVRRFVASALGRRTIAGDKAERLVRAAAYELILPPRLLDYRIWKYGTLDAGRVPPRPFPSGGGPVKRRRPRLWTVPA